MDGINEEEEGTIELTISDEDENEEMKTIENRKLSNQLSDIGRTTEQHSEINEMDGIDEEKESTIELTISNEDENEELK
ncbi:unnamed protein product [Didymodactylos carnosus]|uniref:Uncharacterized protein n=1 Tax=Didymodactylos carnosus TaxID=1234261 RepID=A0A816CWJ7_9BILA|nr:unnamed protein product [Didymodactylos carnosus]CAF4527002.1 unnamed protein product [Didymodactylos carnosus]